MIRNMIMKRTKLIFKDFALALLKPLSTLAIQMTLDESNQTLEMTVGVRRCNLRTSGALVESPRRSTLDWRTST